jgi:hypothetical protein
VVFSIFRVKLLKPFKWPGFHSDLYFSQALIPISIGKKKKLTDIRFFLAFPGLKERLFSMDLDLRLMFVEHQSTSGTKIRRRETLYKSAIA